MTTRPTTLLDPSGSHHGLVTISHLLSVYIHSYSWHPFASRLHIFSYLQFGFFERIRPYPLDRARSGEMKKCNIAYLLYVVPPNLQFTAKCSVCRFNSKHFLNASCNSDAVINLVVVQTYRFLRRQELSGVTTPMENEPASEPNQ